MEDCVTRAHTHGIQDSFHGVTTRFKKEFPIMGTRARVRDGVRDRHVAITLRTQELITNLIANNVELRGSIHYDTFSRAI